jgi:2-aminoethylphosphonate-pyruvate transaminase
MISGHKDKALFTPGPLNTNASTKRAMLRDLGSRDTEFIEVVRDVRSRLVGLGDGHEEYTSILM